MVYQLSCPHCSSPIYFADRHESDEDFQEGLCRCRLVFAMQQLGIVQLEGGSEGTNDGNGASEAKVRSLVPWTLVGNARHTYRLVALDPEGRRVRVQFSGKPNVSSNGLDAWPEEHLLMLYAVPSNCIDRDPLPDQLMRVTAATIVSSDRQAGEGASLVRQATGIEVASMRWRLWGRRLKAGGLATALALGSALPMHSLTHPSYWMAAGAAAIATAAVAGWSDRYRLRDRRLLRRLDAEQRLLQQQFAMEQKQALFAHQLRQQQRLLKRLQTLQERMQAADESMYARRIEVVKRGIATVKETTTLTQNLRDGYGQLVKILAIEYETSRLAEQLPENSSRDILARVSELEAMEERRTSLEALVNPQQLLKAI